MTNDQALDLQKQIFDKALAILVKKRQDYSGDQDPFANFRQSEMWGVEPWRGAAIRLTDKLSRFRRLAENGGTGKVEESIEDTIVDALNYTVIMYELYLETKEAG